MLVHLPSLFKRRVPSYWKAHGTRQLLAAADQAPCRLLPSGGAAPPHPSRLSLLPSSHSPFCSGMSPAPAPPPVLAFWERTPPYAASAAAKLAACSLEVRSEAKGTKDTLNLAFPSG